jgi:hypothetical protein
LQPKGKEAHSSCKNGFALQEEGEEEEAHGVRMLCFAGEIVGESGSAMVGMPASCNSEGLATLGVHPSVWVSIMSICLSDVLMFSDGCNRSCGLLLFDLQDDWLSSLKEFVRTAHSLALQRQPKTVTNGTKLSLTIITPTVSLLC